MKNTRMGYSIFMHVEKNRNGSPLIIFWLASYFILNNLFICAFFSILIGHQWLLNTLGVKPKSSWSVDPFGHGSAFPYVLKASGVDGTYEASFRFSELLLFLQHILSTKYEKSH